MKAHISQLKHYRYTNVEVLDEYFDNDAPLPTQNSELDCEMRNAFLSGEASRMLFCGIHPSESAYISSLTKTNVN